MPGCVHSSGKAENREPKVKRVYKMVGLAGCHRCRDEQGILTEVSVGWWFPDLVGGDTPPSVHAEFPSGVQVEFSFSPAGSQYKPDLTLRTEFPRASAEEAC